MLEAAHGLDDLQRLITAREKAASKKGKKAQGNKDREEERAEESEDSDKAEGDKESEEDESPVEFMSRVNRYVALHLSRASSSKRDSYKDGLVYQARKELISEFLKASILGRCQNEGCGR